VYKFIKNLVQEEFSNICQRLATQEELTFVKKKNAKIRKRMIIFNESLPTCDKENIIINTPTEK